MASKETEKKGALTLERLVSYDDVITDALVDKVYFWTAIRKNHGGRFSASRGLLEEDIANILREDIIIDKDVNEGMQRLGKLPGLKKYMASLKDKEREHFVKHLRRYVSIYMPDCPFEVTTTNRYTITDHEASITARRDIQPREEIKYLTGVQVAMTEEQEKTLELARKDFSLVISSRKKTRSLFLGPARFANHDCDANAKLSTKGYDGMQIVAVKPINEGEEITVSYGEDYFGDDNEECLCHTCESKQVNGWALFKREDSDEEDENDEVDEPSKKDTPVSEEGLYSFRNKRKYEAPNDDTSRDSTPAKRAKLSPKGNDEVDEPASKKDTPVSEEESYSFRNKRKYEGPNDDTSRDSTPAKCAKLSPIGKLVSPINQNAPALIRQAILKKAASTPALRPEVPVSSIENPSTNLAASSQTLREIRSQQRVGLLHVSVVDQASRTTTPETSQVSGSPKSTLSTDATSVDDNQPATDTDEQPAKAEPTAIQTNLALGVAVIKDEVTTVVAPWSALFADDTSSSLSELSDGREFDDVLQRIVKRKRPQALSVPRNTRSISRNEAQNRVGTPIAEHTLDEGWIKNTRIPGDYMTSKSRLAGKDCKWAECQTCEVDFVQLDGHRGTRKECPRCERHSKLYGYAWPKTEREGKHDKEKRVLDHRTIHRFVDADEEKTLRKDKSKRSFRRAILERFSTPLSGRGSSVSSSLEADSGRKRRRLRKTM